MPPLGLSQVGGLTIYAFAPSELGVFARPNSTGFDPIASTEILSVSNAKAALDGPMFENCSGQVLPFGNASYALSQCGYPQFLVFDQASGVSRESDRPNEGLTISIVGGRPIATRGASPAPGASVAVQLFPTLVFNGQVVVSNNGTNANRERRAALAVFPDRLAFIIGSSDMISFASAIRNLGATAAGYTDGGGSTSLVTPQGYYGSGEHRRVPTWLIARGGVGMGPIIGALVVAGIVGGILYATANLKVHANPTESVGSIRTSLENLRTGHRMNFYDGDRLVVSVRKDRPNWWFVEMADAPSKSFQFNEYTPSEFEPSMGSARIKGGPAGVAKLVQGLLNGRSLGAHANPSKSRDEELGKVAKTKAMIPGIGDPLWLPKERVERTAMMTVSLYDETETVTLLWTTAENSLGARKIGRLLIAGGASAYYLFGAAFWVEEYGRRCIQSIWIEPEYRRSAKHARSGQGVGTDFGAILLRMAKEAGIDCVLKPVSTAGASWAKRHGLDVLGNPSKRR